MYNWSEMLDAAHKKAFSVASITPIEVLNELSQALNDALKAQESFDEFRHKLSLRLAAT